ncbi:MAG: putative permease [Firmicutes bacterium ADurb.Bin182]|nr:MAG: putative permease [Firmicutes bacterium ADurb.Bin182]
MSLVFEYLKDTVLYVLETLAHNFPALILGVLVAAALQVYLDPEKMKNWLMRRSAVSVPAAVAFGALTPFCACGTMAVVISMLATALPWGPVMAFLTSSPLMSPDGFVLISGIISPSFAFALALASIVIGVGSGYITHMIERKTHCLDNQLRFGPAKTVSVHSECCCSAIDSRQIACCAAENGSECDCNCDKIVIGHTAICCNAPDFPNRLGTLFTKYKIDRLLKAAFDTGVKKILPFFSLFAGVGYLINRFIPSEWITTLFGEGSIFAVPLAAAVGLPLYISTSSSLPLIDSLMQSGVSAGAMLAFMITGPGTSAGVLAGIATIMKKKALALYIALLLAGAILIGYAYELILSPA